MGRHTVLQLIYDVDAIVCGCRLMPAGAVVGEDGEKCPIEAAQERAKGRGRLVLVVSSDLAPNLSWEPTTSECNHTLQHNRPPGMV